jgi:hypothetical protein
MQATNSRRTKIAVLPSLAIVAAVIAMAVLVPGQSGPSPSVTAPMPMTAVATGETQNGMAVYRLPAVAVTASRSVELAKMEEEDRQALAKANAAPAAKIGVATGETENGAPVYRLPKVAVTVSRSEELARMIQEDKLALGK